ncbi:hypothetical protein YC2023_062880 [Brassica napus]
MQSYSHANSSTLSRPPPYWLLYLRKTSQKPSYSIQAPGSHATDAAGTIFQTTLLHSLFNHNLYYMIRVWTEVLVNLEHKLGSTKHQ